MHPLKWIVVYAVQRSTSKRWMSTLDCRWLHQSNYMLENPLSRWGWDCIHWGSRIDSAHVCARKPRIRITKYKFSFCVNELYSRKSWPNRRCTNIYRWREHEWWRTESVEDRGENFVCRCQQRVHPSQRQWVREKVSERLKVARKLIWSLDALQLYIEAFQTRLFSATSHQSFRLVNNSAMKFELEIINLFISHFSLTEKNSREAETRDFRIQPPWKVKDRKIICFR